jgi:zinc transport system substrate-binding protein
MRQLAALSLLLPLALGGCGASGSGPAAGEAGPRVVASLYPLAFAAATVAPPGVTVADLTPTGAEPHDLELAPGEVREVLGAALVVYAAGFQPAVDRAVAMRRGRSLDVLSVPGLDLLGADPHVWLDPRRYARVARAIAAELGDEARAAALERRLAALDAELARGLAGCRRREVVTSHAAFGYLADRYDLEQSALSGLDPEAEPAPRDLERLAREMRRLGATTVFSEPLASARGAETLARAAGARLLTLNPIEGLTGEESGRGEDYFSLMRANLAALRQGLECPPSSS